MAVAAYDSDLTAANSGLIDDAEDVSTWDESSNAAWDDGAGISDEPDFFIQGASSISSQMTKTGVATLIHDDAGTFTVDTDGAITIWGFWASPPSLATYANGGMRTLVGDGLGDFEAFLASGSDFEPNPYGGWYNYAFNPDDATADATVGSPSAYQFVGMAVNATAQARGQPFAVDAIRVGRCTLEVTEGQAPAADYGTFLGMGAFDTSTDERLGLFQLQAGSYRWQGLMSLGITATAVDFRDSNTSIVIANTPVVSAAFNRIEIHHVDSNVEWTSININAVGVNDPTIVTNSIGTFEVIDNATVVKIGCTFTDMGTFIYNDGSNPNTISTTTYRRCGQVSQIGATFTSCDFEATTAAAALLADTLGEVTDCLFTSDGSSYACDIGTITVTGSLTWNNQETGYVAGSAGTDVGVTPTGNETIVVVVNSGQVLTINVTAGASTPSVAATGAGTVNVVAGAVTTAITVIDINDQSLLAANVYLAASDGSGDLPYQESVTISSVTTVATVVHAAHGFAVGNKVSISGANEEEYNGAKTVVTVPTDGTYTYTVDASVDDTATGTIIATGLIFSDFADGTGVSPSTGLVSDSRTFSLDQPVAGRARLSTTPGSLYKSAPITGEINSSTGLAITVQLIPDE